MKLTKKRREGGGWTVVIDGKPTSLHISKGDPPRYREPQMYDVLEGADMDAWLFEARSVHAAERVIQRIIEATK